MAVSLIHVPSPGLFSFHWFALSNFEVILSYCFVLGYYLLEACYFLMRDRKGVDLDGRRSVEDLAEVDKGESVIRTYYMRKNLFLMKRGEILR